MQVEVLDKITETMDRRRITLEVFLDLSKAFNSIRHEMHALWAELDQNGVSLGLV